MKRLAAFFVLFAVLTALVVPAPVGAEPGSVRSGGSIARDFISSTNQGAFAGTGIGYSTTDDWSVFAVIRRDVSTGVHAIASIIKRTATQGGWAFYANAFGGATQLGWDKAWVVGLTSSGLTVGSNWTAVGAAADQDAGVTFWALRYGTDATAQESIVSDTQAYLSGTPNLFLVGDEGSDQALDGALHRVAIWRGASGGGVITAAQFTALAFGQIRPRDITTPTLVRDYVMTGADSPDTIDGTTSDPLTFTGTTIIAGPSLRLPWSRVGASGAR